MNNLGGIDKALAYLKTQQLTNGSFASYSSPYRRRFHRPIVYQTTFFTSLILASLHDLPQPAAGRIRKAATDYLLTQKTRNWTFNYWDRHSAEAKSQPYPDDLDDTFCALTALFLERPQLFTGQVMAQIAKTLIRAEVRPGGPYRTWLVGANVRKIWKDVDVAVNANIANFLSLQEVTLPNVVLLIEQALETQPVSPYYPEIYPILYNIGRWYRGAKSHLVVDALVGIQRHGHWNNPLHTALAVSTLLRYEVPPKQLRSAIDYLKQHQRTDGSWPASAFCIDPALGDKTYYAGAAALTTAFCIEALQLYAEAQVVTIQSAPRKASKPSAYDAVVSEVERVITALPEAALRTYTRKALRQLIDNDTDGQIVLLPWFIAEAAKLKVRPAVLHQLAVASLWGWLAYTIYDDFLDQEGDPRLLPSANVAMRNLIRTQDRILPRNIEFQADVHLIMDRLDGANAWEVSHCRGTVQKGTFYIDQLPDYGRLGQLGDRSLGHTIAGLGVLYAAGHAADSRTMIALRRFFCHYLIARQLNDDAHDWEHDLRLGHVNAVAVPIIQHWLAGGHNLQDGINLKKDIKLLRQIMWDEVVVDISRLIKRHVATARSTFKAKDVQLDGEQLETLLKPLEASAEEALRQRAETLDFITALEK